MSTLGQEGLNQEGVLPASQPPISPGTFEGYFCLSAWVGDALCASGDGERPGCYLVSSGAQDSFPPPRLHPSILPGILNHCVFLSPLMVVICVYVFPLD